MTTQQIVNYPFLYINGGHLSRTSNTVLSLEAAILRDSTNVHDMNIGNYHGLNSSVNPSVATSISSAFVGAGGLDTGTVANNSWYYLYVIGDSTNFRPTSAILSLSTSSPKLPFGYNVFRRVGQVRTNGSAQFLAFRQYGGNAERIYQYDTPLLMTTPGTTSLSAVDLSTAVPAAIVANPVIFNATFAAATAGNSFDIRPFGGASAAMSGTGPVISQPMSFPSFIMGSTLDAGVKKIQYVMTSASDVLNLRVVGYYDTI